MTQSALPVVRLGQDALVALVGQEGFDRLQNKQRGGYNGYKGNRYEHLFIAHRVARLMKKFIETGEDATVEWQSDGFVDDVVVRRDGQGSFKGYQLKNAQAVSWVGDIASDFQMQYSVCQNEAYSDIRLRLVCSDAELAVNLAATVPGPISGYSKAFFFPFDNVLLPLLGQHDWLKNDFGFLSKHEQPTTVDAEQVAAVVMGACDSLGQRLTVSAVMHKARSMSPTLLRPIGSDEDASGQLMEELRQLFSSWEDFSYQINKGFLSWVAFGGTMKGVLSFDCFSPKFNQWQRKIILGKPGAFQDVEVEFI